MKSKPKIVFFDNNCPMCTAVTGGISGSSQKGKFELRPIAAGHLPGGVSREDVEKKIHVVDGDGKIYKGSEAILKILEEYPGGKFFAKIGGVPVIKQLLAIGYAFVAANRHFMFGSHGRIFYLKLVVACGFIAGFFLSVKLWVDSRWYPLTPVFKIFPAIPFPADYIYFFALVALLVFIILSPRPRMAIAAFSVLLIISFFLDQSRLQPWAYQYLFILIGLGLFSWRSADTRGESNALNVARIVIGTTYIWSGLQKVNPSFMLTTFPWLAGHLMTVFPQVIIVGFFAPFIEFGIGIGLFTKRYRNLAVWVAVVVHLSILLAIGPWGFAWNAVVWPWQIAMILFVLLLFYKTDFHFADLFGRDNFIFSKLVVVLFLIMPLFNFFGLWDSYLSDALYTGNTAQGTIYFDSAVLQGLPPAISKYATSIASGQDSLNISMWSLGEMDVPSYPEARIYENVTKYICASAADAPSVELVVQDKPVVFEPPQEQRYNCSEL